MTNCRYICLSNLLLPYTSPRMYFINFDRFCHNSYPGFNKFPVKNFAVTKDQRRTGLRARMYTKSINSTLVAEAYSVRLPYQVVCYVRFIWCCFTVFFIGEREKYIIVLEGISRLYVIGRLKNFRVKCFAYVNCLSQWSQNGFIGIL